MRMRQRDKRGGNPKKGKLETEEKTALKRRQEVEKTEKKNVRC